MRINEPVNYWNLRSPKDIFLTLLLLSSLFFLVAHKINNCDLGWQLKTGEIIFENWEIPETDPFSALSHGREWIDLHWLFQLASYLTFDKGGALALTLFHFFLLGSSLLLLLFTVRGKADSSLLHFLLLIALLASRERYFIRPENFSLFFLILCIFILEKWKSSGSRFFLIPLPVLQVVWVNTEGLFVLGLVVILIYLVAEAADRFMDKKQDRTSLVPLSLVFVFSLLACLLNPYFIRGFLFPFELFTRIGPGFSSFETIAEFTSVFQRDLFNSSMGFYFFLAGVFVSLVMTWRKEMKTEHLLLLSAFFFLSLIARRNVLLFSFVAAPFMAMYLSQSELILRTRRYLTPFYVILCLLIPFLVSTNLIYYSERNAREFGLGFSEEVNPEKAIRYIESNDLKGNLFASMCCAGYVIRELGPGQKVFFDSRLEVHDSQGYGAYRKMLFDDAFWKKEAKSHDIKLVLLNHTDRAAFSRILYLLNDQEWRLKYIDNYFFLFSRTGSFDTEQLPANQNPVFFNTDFLKAEEKGILPIYKRYTGEFSLAVFLSLMGNKDMSIKIYEKIIDWNPIHSDALNNLAWELMESGSHWKRAEEMVLRAINIEREASAYHTLSRIYLAGNKKESAREALQKAIELCEDGNRKKAFQKELEKLQ